MTSFVSDGPSVITVKMMALCAVLNGEKALARRYFHMLRQQPFEGAFIEKYEPLIQHPEKLADYPELKLAYSSWATIPKSTRPACCRPCACHTPPASTPKPCPNWPSA